jgi:membrane protease YdiL (CAAX protease family)
VALFALLISVGIPVYLLVLRPVEGRQSWWISEMLAVSILFIIALPMGAVLAGVAAPLTLVGLSVVTVVQNLLFVGASVYVVLVRYRLAPLRLGVRADGWRHQAALGLVCAAVTVPLAVASEHAAVYLLGLIEGPAQAAARAAAEHLSDPLRPVLQALTDVAPVAWVFALLAVVVPVGEEVFFRGLVYGGLRARWGVTAAALASALFFAAVHVQIVHALPIFVLGVLLALLYERTGGLLAGIVTHAVNNVVAVLSLWRGWGF